jgi:hypothetical protein
VNLLRFIRPVSLRARPTSEWRHSREHVSRNREKDLGEISSKSQRRNFLTGAVMETTVEDRNLRAIS